MTEPAGGIVPGTSTEVLRVVCTQAEALVRALPEPVRRIAVRSGSCSVEIEWPTPDPSVAAASSRIANGPALTTAPSSGGGPGRQGDDDRTAGETGHIVRAPLVGTFFRAPEPGAVPYVSVGDAVEAGQTVGIVEAMKLLNPIAADVAGRIVEVYAADNDAVEFDQPLLRIVPGMRIAGDGHQVA